MKETKIRDIINSTILPTINLPFNEIGNIKKIYNIATNYKVYLEIKIPAVIFLPDICTIIATSLKKQFKIIAEVYCDCNIYSSLNIGHGILSFNKIKNCIAVVAGKGGVGKSTIAANLALGLTRQGAKVGILDADIFGPSTSILFGIDAIEKPKMTGNYFSPIVRNNIKIMSISFFMPDSSSPVIWRGPIASRSLLQMINTTLWDELDYLIIDFPPGTGDIPLTLAQKIPISAALFITTAQELAIADVCKSIQMFNKLSVNILGIIENMSEYHCSNCDSVERIFNSNAIIEMAKDYDIPILGKLPLVAELCQVIPLAPHNSSNDTKHKIYAKFQEIVFRMTAALLKYKTNH